MLSDRRIRTSLVAISTDLFLTLIKVALAFATGSAALKADAFHSATDFIVSWILLVGIVIRIRQEKTGSTKNHKFGHLVEPVLAILVALIILYVPYEIVSELGASTTKKIDNLAIGIFGTISIILVLLFISRLKLFVGRETDSLALEADGYHSMADVFTSIAVLVSLLGFMVGINLDEIIAVVIAIIIGVTGLELLVSGIKAIIKNSEYDQLSFFDFLSEVYINSIGRHALSRYAEACASSINKHKFLLLLGLLTIFFLGGFRIIPEGKIGKRYQLGSVSQQSLTPGLHYALPWPLGKVEERPNGLIYVVNLGTRAQALETGEQRIWIEMKEKSLRKENADYYVTSDKQLIDSSISIFYKIHDINLVASSIASHQDLIQEVSGYSFSQFILSHSLESLLSGDRKVLKQKLVTTAQENIKKISSAIEIVDIQFQTYRPPALVIGAYRDVINAQQEKLQSINRAIADRSKALPLSRAAYVESISNATSKSSTKKLEAEGNISKISALSDIQRTSRAGFEFNAYINMIERSLEGKDIIVRDERLSNSDLRLWQRDKN